MEVHHRLRMFDLVIQKYAESYTIFVKYIFEVNEGDGEGKVTNANLEWIVLQSMDNSTPMAKLTWYTEVRTEETRQRLHAQIGYGQYKWLI